MSCTISSGSKYIADLEAEVVRLQHVITAGDVLANQQLEKQQEAYNKLGDEVVRLREALDSRDATIDQFLSMWLPCPLAGVPNDSVEEG